MRAVYDTRFFMEYFYSADEKLLKKMRDDLRATKDRYVSAITVHEVYNLTLSKDGRKAAKSRAEVLERDFKVVKVDAAIAVHSAELRHKYRIHMSDSIIAATACRFRAPVVTDDEHFRLVEEVKVKWF